MSPPLDKPHRDANGLQRIVEPIDVPALQDIQAATVMRLRQAMATYRAPAVSLAVIEAYQIS